MEKEEISKDIEKSINGSQDDTIISKLSDRQIAEETLKNLIIIKKGIMFFVWLVGLSLGLSAIIFVFLKYGA